MLKELTEDCQLLREAMYFPNDLGVNDALQVNRHLFNCICCDTHSSVFTKAIPHKYSSHVKLGVTDKSFHGQSSWNEILNLLNGGSKQSLELLETLLSLDGTFVWRNRRCFDQVIELVDDVDQGAHSVSKCPIGVFSGSCPFLVKKINKTT